MNTEDKREVREAKLQNPLGIIALFASLAEVSGIDRFIVFLYSL